MRGRCRRRTSSWFGACWTCSPSASTRRCSSCTTQTSSGTRPPNLSPGGVDDLAGVYHGHEGVQNYWRRWLSAWKDIQFEVQDVLDADGEVVALIHNQRMWGRHSGIPVDFPPFGLVFTIRDGKVVRWRSFRDQKSALEAAGL